MTDDTAPGRFHHVGGHQDRGPTSLSLGDNDTGQQMARGLLHRRGQCEHAIGRQPVVGDHLMDPRFPDGERSGFVEHGRVHGRQRFQRASMTHDDGTTRGPVDAADDRDRCRQDEGAGGCHHQYRQHAVPVMRDQPRQQAGAERERREPYSPAIRGALERTLGRLSRAHQLHDPGILAFL